MVQRRHPRSNQLLRWPASPVGVVKSDSRNDFEVHQPAMTQIVDLRALPILTWREKLTLPNATSFLPESDSGQVNQADSRFACSDEPVAVMPREPRCRPGRG